jgi:hypothetical protein
MRETAVRQENAEGGSKFWMLDFECWIFIGKLGIRLRATRLRRDEMRKWVLWRVPGNGLRILDFGFWMVDFHRGIGDPPTRYAAPA